MEIARLKQIPRDKQNTTFVSGEDKELRLNLSSFFAPDRYNGFSEKPKRHLGYLFELDKNPAPVYCKVNTSQNSITKIEEMPYLSKNLRAFYNTNQQSDNYALSVEKFGRFKKDKLEYMHPDGKKLFHQYQHNSELIEGIKEKNTVIFKELIRQKQSLTVLNFTQHWRIVIGLGNASVYNNGFTFHPVFGIPYLPGQAVKGIIRSFVIRELFKKDEKLAEKDPIFCYLFGCSENSYDKTPRKGKINFMDAFPVNEFQVVADIMNPHYGDYYGDDTNTIQPSDDKNPVPIFFLSLKEAEFSFMLYLNQQDDVPLDSLEFFANEKKEVKKKYKDFKSSIEEFRTNQPPALLLEKLMELSLKYQGIGGKTAVGYGRLFEMKKIDISKLVEDEVRLEQEKIDRDKQKEENKKEEKRIINDAKENGIYESIKNCTGLKTQYSGLEASINNYKMLIDLDKDGLLPKKDFEVVLKQLDIVYKNLKGNINGAPKKVSFLNKESNKKLISSWIGKEKMEKWFNEKHKAKL
jgi:CRISPR-associated protein Cmr6